MLLCMLEEKYRPKSFIPHVQLGHGEKYYGYRKTTAFCNLLDFPHIKLPFDIA